VGISLVHGFCKAVPLLLILSGINAFADTVYTVDFTYSGSGDFNTPETDTGSGQFTFTGAEPSSLTYLPLLSFEFSDLITNADLPGGSETFTLELADISGIQASFQDGALAELDLRGAFDQNDGFVSFTVNGLGGSTSVAAGEGGSETLASGPVTITSITSSTPEPGTLGICLSGLAAVFMLLKRRSRQAWTNGSALVRA